MRDMQIQVIRTDEDHRVALAEIEALWGAREGTDDGDRLEALVALVESYEARRWPLAIDPSFDPVDVLHFAIEELGHTIRAELTEILGSRSRVSEILSRRAPSTRIRGRARSGQGRSLREAVSEASRTGRCAARSWWRCRLAGCARAGAARRRPEEPPDGSDGR